MSFRRFRRHVLLITSMTLPVTACEDTADPGGVLDSLAGAVAADVARVMPNGPVSIEDRMAMIAIDEPTFGGMYIDGAGRLAIWATATGRQSQIVGRIRANVPDRDELFERPIVWRTARYRFADLYVWRARINVLFATDGVISIDLDEGRNRLEVGVLDSSVSTEVYELLPSLDVPQAAVSVYVREPPQMAADLQDYFRGTAGGFQVQSTVWTCTLGFNAVRDDVVSYATNGHCSDDWGDGSEATEFYQCCKSNPSHYIGDEYLEAELFSSTDDARCPAGADVCKYSDILLGEYDADSIAIVGVIGRTINRSPTSGSIQIDTVNGPFLYVTATSLGALQGDTINKIGIATGWTYGPVTSTCETDFISNGYASWYIVCFDVALAGADVGDSGSAVFDWGGDTDVTLLGQVFGRWVDGSDIYLLYSQLNFITGDPSIGSMDLTCC